MVRFLDGLLKMTYDLWQPSLSGLNMAQCYGTGYVVRRAAVDSIGGWSTFTPIAEVWLTAFHSLTARSLCQVCIQL